MTGDKIYQLIKEEFEATFTRELIPGILHNFANPLNSIMGRSKLLQRRSDDIFRKLAENYPQAAAAMNADLEKMSAEIKAINNESDIFYDSFRSLMNKFYSLEKKGESRINLSQLLTDEMRFFNFYMDFKHEIKKTMQLSIDIPGFRGNTAELSVAFWRLIRFAVGRAKKSSLQEFHIKTEYDDKYVRASIRDSGGALPSDEVEVLMGKVDSGVIDTTGSTLDKEILLPLLIMKNYQAKIIISGEGSFNTISIGFPLSGDKHNRQ
ncbi:MAG TPA: HAMP domain-containing histidine kinase [Deltaproteobacteria bacterium]|nr:HAMP domain-containing histidine kinase [Deltaproteobacteria bacterium]